MKLNVKKSFNTNKTGLWSAMAISLCLFGCGNDATAEQSTDKNATVQTVSADNMTVTKDTSATSSTESDPEVVAALEANFKASGFEQKITSAIPTQMQNIYWVSGEGIPSFFADKEGRHVIQGQIVEIGGTQPVDISQSLVAKNAKEKLAQVDKKDMIIYPANGETKAVVYSFTDADCPYCSKLHEEMQEINDLGIEVRYLAWPRSERSIPKMEAIWCSDDRKTAMDKAKAGDTLNVAACNSPVLSQIQLGMSLGVSGTPAIFTEAGNQIGGYLPAAELAKAAIAN